jgi:hypothetical protein
MGSIPGFSNNAAREREFTESAEFIDSEKNPRSSSFLALAFYQFLAIAFYGRALFAGFGSFYQGRSSDPAYYIWCMVWWPYALSHHLNPFFTKLLWAPDGFNVAWSTSIPLLSLLATPLTIWRGPVEAFNLLNLVLPAFAAWSGFLLIRHISGQSGPALLGGYLYGFSSFMAAAQAAGHIVFTAAFLIPAAVYLFLAYLEGKLGTRRFVLLLTITFVAQFLISIEMLATMLTFGGFALGAAALFWPDRREQLAAASIAAGAAVLATAVIVSPYLFAMLQASGIGLHPVWAGTAASDLLEFIVPTRVIMIGRFPLFRAIAAHYVYDSYFWDSGAYASLPALTVVIIFLRSRWHSPWSKFLALMIVTVAVAMLGRHLRVGGHNVSKLPWLLIGALPFINSAVTARFAVYYHLLLALTVALWMAEKPHSTLVKWAVAGLIVLLQLPNLDSSFWVHPLNVPRFFTSGSLPQKLREGDTVLVLPYGRGDSMLWQVYSHMYFALPEGFTGPIPPSFQAWPIVRVFRGGGEIPQEQLQFNAFLSAHQIKTILIDPSFPRAPFWRTLLQDEGARVEEIDGVILAQLPAAQRPH